MIKIKRIRIKHIINQKDFHIKVGSYHFFQIPFTRTQICIKGKFPK